MERSARKDGIDPPGTNGAGIGRAPPHPLAFPQLVRSLRDGGRGKSEQDREVKREASIPILGIDYMWMTGEDDEGGDESLRGMPILALADQEAGWVS